MLLFFCFSKCSVFLVFISDFSSVDIVIDLIEVFDYEVYGFVDIDFVGYVEGKCDDVIWFFRNRSMMFEVNKLFSFW